MKSNGTISAAELSDWTGYTDRHHRDLADAGHFPPPVKGLYQHPITIQALFKYAKADKAGSKMAAIKLARETDKGRQEKVSADLAEGKVIEKALVRQMITRCILNIKFKALGVAKKLAQRLAIETDPINVEQILNSEMRDVISDAQFDYGFVECPECGMKVI